MYYPALAYGPFNTPLGVLTTDTEKVLALARATF